jgi:glycosyltransferase involved in cell wall biosynthesis
MKLLKIIIPCFNERDSLPILIGKLQKLNKDIHFIIVNNGSTDESKQFLDSLTKVPMENLDILHIRENLGYGDGIYRGLQIGPKSKFIGWIHGDLQFEFFKLDEIYEDLAVMEDKYVFYKGIRTGRSILDRFFSFFMEKIASLILRLKFKEINAQPTIFSSNLLEKIKSPPIDFSFDTYVYWLGLKNNYKFIRKEFTFPPRLFGSSKWNFGLKTKFIFSKSLISYFFTLRK